MASAAKKPRENCDDKLWTRDKTLILIAIYKSYPDIWDVSRELYFNREHREDRLVMIGRIMKINVREVDMKIKSLHAQYHEEYQKLEMQKMISQTDESKVSDWEYFDALKFLSSSGLSCSTTIPKSEKIEPNIALVDEHISLIRPTKMAEKVNPCSAREIQQFCQMIRGSLEQLPDQHTLNAMMEMHKIIIKYRLLNGK